MAFNAFERRIFPLQSTEGTGNLGMVARVAGVPYGKASDPSSVKQMLQRLPTALAQVKAGNTSEKVLSNV